MSNSQNFKQLDKILTWIDFRPTFQVAKTFWANTYALLLHLFVNLTSETYRLETRLTAQSKFKNDLKINSLLISGNFFSAQNAKYTFAKTTEKVASTWLDYFLSLLL